MKVDLHTHTTCSDGTYTPKELIYYAKEKGLDAIAISDHDCLKALKDARTYADLVNIKLIDAIEFAGFYIDREVHILGLFVNLDNTSFVDIVTEIETGRRERNLEMIKRFNKLNIPMTINDLNNGDEDKVITRSHFAEYLLNNNYVQSKDEAFQKYLWEGCETYLPREYYNTKEIIDIIKDAGGISSLAHPTLYKLSDDEIETLVGQMSSEGLNAIECYHSTYTKKQEDFILSLAHKYNLDITGGSDFHGATKENLDLVTGYGNLSIPENILELLLEKYNYSL